MMSLDQVFSFWQVKLE